MIMKDIQIINIVICYKNEKEIISYAQTLMKLDNREYLSLIIVVNDYGRIGKSVFEQNLQKLNINYDIFDPQCNLGYMNGLLYGYKEFENKYKFIPKYVIMSNSDIEINDTSFISILLEKKYPDEIACIGPAVYVTKFDSYDNPIAEKRRSKKTIDKLIFIFSLPIISQIYIFLSLLKPKYFKRKKDTISRVVYEVHGCFFILVGMFAHQIKNEKYGCLLYSEETFVAENVLLRGYKEFYDADIEVVHNEHSVTGSLSTKTIVQHLKQSLQWIKRTYYTNRN